MDWISAEEDVNWRLTPVNVTKNSEKKKDKSKKLGGFIC